MKYVLVNQGNAKSKCAAIWLSRITKPEDEIHSLFFDWGVPNAEEMKKSALKIAQDYCTTHAVFQGQMVVDGLKLTPFTFNEETNDLIPLPLITVEERATCIPFIFDYPYYIKKYLLEALGYARNVVYADKVISGDMHVYTQESLAEFNRIINMGVRTFGRQTLPIVEMPFLGLDLPEVLESLNLSADIIKDTVNCKDYKESVMQAPNLEFEEVTNEDIR